MTTTERAILVAVLLVLAALVTADLVSDSRHGGELGHLGVEAAAAALALFGSALLIRDAWRQRQSLRQALSQGAEARRLAERWRQESARHVEGVSQAMDAQMLRWGLSQAEQECARLLIKGLSLKEIAEARGTTPKTARAHAVAVYAKSGLRGRSDLAAFFLEDLLAPAKER